MSDPRLPRPGPGPIRPGPGPIRRPIPWTPFGPGDTTATPDPTEVDARAAKTRAALQKAQLELTRMRHGPGPDNTPPKVVETTRADGLWPFLLIRYDAGDTGARPLDPGIIADMDGGDFWSPDILTTRGYTGTSVIVDREGFPELKKWDSHGGVTWGLEYDIWAHVWNLGQGPATGVRVRAFLTEVDVCLGTAHVDLGDRLSDTCHRVVKIASYVPGTSGEGTVAPLVVVAECLTDVASGDRSNGMDRHCARTFLRAN